MRAKEVFFIGCPLGSALIDSTTPLLGQAGRTRSIQSVVRINPSGSLIEALTMLKYNDFWAVIKMPGDLEFQ
jgi:hypothetical protein